MAFSKYCEDNRKITDERLRDTNRSGKYLAPAINTHKEPTLNAKQHYFEVVSLNSFPEYNTINFCSLQITTRYYIIKRKGEMVRLDDLNEEMLKLNAKLIGEKRAIWQIKRSSITLSDLLLVLLRCKIRVLIN